MDVSLRLGLFQHDHGVGLPQEGAGSTQLSQFDQLQNHLGGKMGADTKFTIFIDNPAAAEGRNSSCFSRDARN